MPVEEQHPMKNWSAAAFAVVACVLPALAMPSPTVRANAGKSETAETAPARPKSGKVEIMKSSELRPGMKGYAWTVFAGTKPEPVPVEIIGVLKNAWGPKQDVILAKMGGKAARTNVAAGMSGSPVYISGKLIGAVALRLSMFSPDAICGITPIELMLEVEDFDNSVPADARTPERVQELRKVSDRALDSMAERSSGGGDLRLEPASLNQRGDCSPGDGGRRRAGPAGFPQQNASWFPSKRLSAFSGFAPAVLREFGPLFQQLGITPVAGGASSAR